MSFRRDGKAANRWRDWRASHAAALSECGLPEAVFRDEAVWENFLAEGYVGAGHGAWSGWKVELLSPEQARRLDDFLRTACADHPFQPSMRILLRRLFRLGEAD